MLILPYLAVVLVVTVVFASARTTNCSPERPGRETLASEVTGDPSVGERDCTHGRETDFERVCELLERTCTAEVACANASILTVSLTIEGSVLQSRCNTFLDGSFWTCYNPKL